MNKIEFKDFYELLNQIYFSVFCAITCGTCHKKEFLKLTNGGFFISIYVHANFATFFASKSIDFISHLNRIFIII